MINELDCEISIDSPTISFIRDLFYGEADLLAESRRSAYSIQDLPRINIFPSEGKLLQLLLHMIKPKHGVEFGTFFGYSAVWLAETLAGGGKLICIERDAKCCALARSTFEKSGVAHKIDLRCCDIDQFIAEDRSNEKIDFCFFDARWADYPRYLEWALGKVRTGGLVIAHNAYAGGFVSLNPASSRFAVEFSKLFPQAYLQYCDEYSSTEREALLEDISGMRKFLAQLASDKRLKTSTVIPSSEGIAVGIVA